MKKILIVLIVISLAFNALLLGALIYEKILANSIEKQLLSQKTNEKVVTFTKLFVQKVLQGDSEISFDDRLELENSVRDLNDQKIFSQWQSFTKSKTNEQAQIQAGNLFILLLDKIYY